MTKLNQNPLIELARVVPHLVQGLRPRTFIPEALAAAAIFGQIDALGTVLEPCADGIAIAIATLTMMVMMMTMTKAMRTATVMAMTVMMVMVRAMRTAMMMVMV